MNIVIIGAQYGDEGKGKITDFLASSAGAIVRYQGGNNAGHTICVDNDTYKLHLIPSGVLYKEKKCILGNGVVLDLPRLVDEIEGLRKRGVDTSNLYVSSSAHVILPHHIYVDEFWEEQKGPVAIGTTKRGIGPAYLSKVNRNGIRVGDLAHPEFFAEKLQLQREFFARMDPSLAQRIWSEESELQIVRDQLAAFSKIRPYVTDTSLLISNLVASENVLFEGAQGTFIDLDHGTYPYVTSSTPTAGGACVGAGIPPTAIDDVVGVLKAYTTRVGAGPFVTELSDAAGDKLREVGGEFGTTTGRPRRCGWLDLVMGRYAARINGFSHLALTKLDILDSFEEIKVCTAYRIDGELVEDYPTDPYVLESAEPVYQTLPGWQKSTKEAKSFDDLPEKAQDYVSFVENTLNVPISIVSVGKSRACTIPVSDPWDSVNISEMFACCEKIMEEVLS